MHPFLLWLFFPNSSHGFCLFRFFGSEWVSKPQRKHIEPLAGKGQNKLWLGPSLVCYVTLLMPSRTKRWFGAVRLMVSKLLGGY